MKVETVVTFDDGTEFTMDMSDTKEVGLRCKKCGHTTVIFNHVEDDACIGLARVERHNAHVRSCQVKEGGE